MSCASHFASSCTHHNRTSSCFVTSIRSVCINFAVDVVGTVKEAAEIQLTLGLKPATSLDEIERKLMEVSDPDSHAYGEHLSLDEADALLAPDHEKLTATVAWLNENFGYERRTKATCKSNEHRSICTKCICIFFAHVLQC